jgi:hypothetical protein
MFWADKELNTLFSHEVPMKNQFAYSTRTGSQMRTYVKVAIWIFILVAAVGIVATVNRYQMLSEVMATPRPLDSNLIPTQTAVVSVPELPIEECPSDPATWTLSDQAMAFGSNLKMVAPQCAYDQLEKTAAWVYATTALGYTRADAAVALDLPSHTTLITNLASVAVVSDFDDQPQTVDVISAVNNSKLAEWRVNPDNEPGLEMSFSGCFATSKLVGGEVVSWGNGYPVVCQFLADYQTQYVVSVANGKPLTIESIKNVRRPMWFGYLGNGSWTWMGSGKVWEADLAKLPALPATLNTTSVEERYGLTVRPLPQDWQLAMGQEFSNAFLAELSSNQ